MAAAMPQNNFKLCIEKIFDSWSVLQLAVQQGFGGYHSVEKAKWFVDATEQWFKDNSNLDPYEVEDFLGEILNNEFDTIAEDGSLSHVACSICKCFSLTQQGKLSEVDTFLSKLPKPNLGQCVKQEKQASDDESEEEECPQGENTAMDVTEPEQGKQDAIPDAVVSTEPHQENHMDADDNTDDDGWTIVRKGKKR